MLYYILKYLDGIVDFPGSGLYKYISFRATCVALLSLFISISVSKKLIVLFGGNNIKEDQRELGLAKQDKKKNTPTMGGIAIILAIIIPTLLFANLHNVYILLLLFTTVFCGVIGFLDDYIKVFYRDKNGLSAKKKLWGQAFLGAIVGLTLFFHKDVVVRESINRESNDFYETISDSECGVNVKSTKTNIPFFKNNEFDYSKLIPFLEGNLTWLIYMIFIIFIVCAMSNAANITDGLDGLAAGSSAIVGLTLVVFAYLSGNFIFAKYLNIMYIPDLGEVSIFCTAFVGSCIGFLWYNAYPAQIFMGDTGSLTLGGLIAVIAIIIRKELLLPLMCGVFVIENLSVVLQVVYFKYTKRKYGAGRRIFLCSPIHHHFQKRGIHESKIAVRFLIVGVLFSILALMTLKVR